MSQPDNISQQLMGLPTTVKIMRLALAAGANGETIVLQFRDYPGTLLRDLWIQVAKVFDKREVLFLEKLGDLDNCSEHTGEEQIYVRLICLYRHDQLRKVAWKLTNNKHKKIEQTNFEPIIFFQNCDVSQDDISIPILELRCNDTESRIIDQYLLEPNKREFHLPQQAMDLKISTLFIQLIHKYLDNYEGSKILTSLLNGACVLSQKNQIDIQNPPLDAYQTVRSLLIDPVVLTTNNSFDGMAAAMIQRANTHLARIQNPETPQIQIRLSSISSSDSQGKQYITRRELANLGNLQSKDVQKIIQNYLNEPTLSAVNQLGLCESLKDVLHLPKTEAAVKKMMMSWAPKQIRTRFDKLVQHGLVTCERSKPNGAIEYYLPESLTYLQTIFSKLPSYQKLQEQIEKERQQEFKNLNLFL